MKIHHLKWPLIFLWTLFCIPSWGSDPVVKVKGIPPEKAVEAGTVSVLTLEVTVEKPYHINSNHPLEEFLIPTSLEFESEPGVEFGDISFPDAEVKEFPFAESPMSVYEGTIKIGVAVTPDKSLTGKDVVLKGSLKYQACNDEICLPPALREFTVEFTVRESSVVQKDPGPDTAQTEPLNPAREDDAVVPDNRPGDAGEESGFVQFDQKSLPVILALVFLGGLALNLTPCVYPMIPITITYFGGQAEGKKGSLIMHSGLYIFGMAVTYSLLGVIAALTGGLFGTALQYPPVLIGISFVMVLLALSMFDVYELRMPAFLNRLAGGSRKGYTGTFLMGLTVGIVAAPCIGPFVFGLLTYVGNRGNALLGFLLFFVLALGLGIPLLILGIFSGSIHRLPRSGEWMVWVRKVFGFILLAMAVFFLKTLFPNPLAYSLTFALILALAGIYLAWITRVAGEGTGFSWLRNIVGIAFFITALFTTVSGLQSYTETYIEDAIHRMPAAPGVGAFDAIQWSPYSEQELEKAQLEGKPVLIDFYADWCAPFKELDRHTFTAPDVVELSKQFYTLKVDLTSIDDPGSEKLRKQYRILGVPTLIFLQPDRSEIEDLRVVGFKPAEDFLSDMEKAYRISVDN